MRTSAIVCLQTSRLSVVLRKSARLLFKTMPFSSVGDVSNCYVSASIFLAVNLPMMTAPFKIVFPIYNFVRGVTSAVFSQFSAVLFLHMPTAKHVHVRPYLSLLRSAEGSPGRNISEALIHFFFTISLSTVELRHPYILIDHTI